jgi:hypothetical protein
MSDVGHFSLEEEVTTVVPLLSAYCIASVARNAAYYHEHPVSSVPEDVRSELYSFLDGTVC